jgi:phenylalanine ammonia-lyase
MRTLQLEFDRGVQVILLEELEMYFSTVTSANSLRSLHASLMNVIREALEATTSKDAVPRMEIVAQACTAPLVDFLLALTPSAPVPASTVSSRSFTPPSALASEPTSPVTAALSMIPSFRQSFAPRSVALLTSLRTAYLSGARGPAPASPHLAHGTRPIYEFVRLTLGVRMHGWENSKMFDTGAMAASRDGKKSPNEEAAMSGELGFDEGEGTVGMNASVIYESIRDGKMQAVVFGLFTSTHEDEDEEAHGL